MIDGPPAQLHHAAVRHRPTATRHSEALPQTPTAHLTYTPHMHADISLSTTKLQAWKPLARACVSRLARTPRRFAAECATNKTPRRAVASQVPPDSSGGPLAPSRHKAHILFMHSAHNWPKARGRGSHPPAGRDTPRRPAPSPHDALPCCLAPSRWSALACIHPGRRARRSRQAVVRPE